MNSRPEPETIPRQQPLLARPRRIRGRSPRHRSAVLGAAMVGVALAASGCGGVVQQAVSDVATAPVCAAITSVQEDITGIDLETLAPGQLDQVQAAANLATTAVSSLGDRVPAGTSTGLEDAQTQLDTAVEGAQGGAEERRAAIESALDGYAARLDPVKEQLGC